MAKNKPSSSSLSFRPRTRWETQTTVEFKWQWNSSVTDWASSGLCEERVIKKVVSRSQKCKSVTYFANSCELHTVLISFIPLELCETKYYSRERTVPAEWLLNDLVVFYDGEFRIRDIHV